MGKTVDIGGRIHNPEVGNVVTGANEILDDTKNKKQDVINSEVDAALEALDTNKQDNLTFDQTPTESSTNPVNSGGVYAADLALQQAIEAILTLIPSAASALNQLADKSFVNSSIATASATFRGTYNLVSDLHLSVTASHQDIATALASAVSTADNNDYCFVQIPTSDTSSDIRVTERYKFNGTAWAYEYDLNNSGFTAQQWEAINSGITALLVTKLGALPTASELATSLAGKQNVLTFDNVPVSGSDNPVKSGGLYQLFTAIDAKFPSDASANNKLVAENRLASYVTAIIEALDASFDLTSADGHVTFRMTQTNGVIASVQILTSDIASASALTTLGGRVSTNETDIANLQAAYAGLTQSDVIVGTLPSSGQQKNKIYRQPDPDHTPPQFYSDYMWNGSTWVLMATYNNAIDSVPTANSHNLVESGGVYTEVNKRAFIRKFQFHGNNNTTQTYAIPGINGGQKLYISLDTIDWSMNNVTATYLIFSMGFYDSQGVGQEVEHITKGSGLASKLYEFTVPSEVGSNGVIGFAFRGDVGSVLNITVSDTYPENINLEKGFQGLFLNNIPSKNAIRATLYIQNPVVGKTLAILPKGAGYKTTIGFYSSQVKNAETAIPGGTSSYSVVSCATVPSNCKSAIVTVGRLDDTSITVDEALAVLTAVYNDVDSDKNNLLIGNGSTIVTKRLYGFLPSRIYRFTPSRSQWNVQQTTDANALKFGVFYVSSDGSINELLLLKRDVVLKDFYDISIPSNIVANGVIDVYCRADVGEIIQLSIEDITDTYTEFVVNSKILKSCKLAWPDKHNVYESWPFGSFFADGDEVVCIYSATSDHQGSSGDVLIRKKSVLGKFGAADVILQHTNDDSFVDPVACMLNNGDYLVIAASMNGFKMVKSSDGGITWTDMGYVQVNGDTVRDECMMGLFCTSSGKLISFVGGTTNCKFIVSDDSGLTWRFVGDTTGTGTLEAGCCELENGDILAILRKDASNPALIRLNAELTEYEILYTFGQFNFPAYYSPTSITKLPDGRFYLLSSSRRPDSNGMYPVIEAIVSESDLLQNNINSMIIAKYPAARLNDFGYSQAVITDDGTVYGYFYGGMVAGVTQIYEMIGC